ncbi:sigma-70 family RNA polymerase sigma factor [Actinosynnema sp. NPDC050436]|uniref:RNA polymerase sigma factor n=1 Tax=Actinosynnema sp. NPDC050436 TaxID=3155659 RepID=UPI0033D02216
MICHTGQDEDSDYSLTQATRAGHPYAFEVLYRRHRTAAHAQARRLTRSNFDADDLVSDAFGRVLSTLQERGPLTYFRSYLLTTIRHLAYDQTRRSRHDTLVAEVTDVTDQADRRHHDAGPETAALAAAERAQLAAVFASLPPRWRAVLWWTEVEGRPPADIAPGLHMTPNAVSALAYRARAALRRAYLHAHPTIPHPGGNRRT